MPISRCQLRNEYSLADPELYRAADKDDPEALLEGVAMAGLVGVLRQLGDLAEFAAEIFHDLHEEVMATTARGHGLMNRVQQLEAEFPSIEKVFLSQTNHLSFFTNTGTDWHPNLRSEQNLITCGDLPRFVMDSYEECRGPPRLFLLDKFDVAGAGACLKRYTDPSFFKMEVVTPGFGVSRVEAHREKRIRKAKKKGTRWRNGDTTPDIAPTHAKLHQLFLEERIENAYSDPARLVKLKKRQLIGSALEAKNRKSYMEKFLETPSPDHKMVCETSIIPLPVKSVSDDVSEAGVRILEISTISPVKRSLETESACSSPKEQEIELKPSSDMGRETDDLVKVHEQMDAGVMDEMSSSHLDVPEETALADHGQKKKEGSIDGYHSDDATSEVDNYSDALTTMDSEMETDNELRPQNSFLDIQKATNIDDKEEHQELPSRFSDSQSFGDSSTSDENSSFKRDRNEEHTELQAQFSDSRSIGTSSTSDGKSSSKRDTNDHMELQDHFSDSQSIGNSSTSDEHSSFKNGRSSLSQADSISTIVENIQPDGCIAPMLLSHTKYYVSKIEDTPSDQQTQMVGSQKTNSVEFNMNDNKGIQEEEIPDSGQGSSNSCWMTSDNKFLRSDPGVTSSAVALSTEIQLDGTPSDPVELHSRLSDDGDRDHIETMAAVPDALFLMKDDAGSAVSSEKDPLSKLDYGDQHFNSDMLLQVSNVSELAPEDQCNDHPVVTVLLAEPQNQNCSEIFVTRESGSPVERSICPSPREVDLSPGITLPHDGLDLKSEDCLLATQINLEDISPVVETPSDSSFTRMHCSDLSHECTQDERDSAGVEVLYSDQQSNVEEMSRMVHHDEISGSTYNVDEKDDCVEHPSSPDFIAENHVLLNEMVPEQFPLEDKTVSAVPSVDSAENQASIVTSPASGLISSSHNLGNSQETLPDSSDFHQMEVESNKVESIEIADLELEKKGNQLEPSPDMTSNIISSPVSSVTYSQESHSTFMDPQEEIDVNEVVAGESLTELEAQRVLNQLEVASADVQSSPNRSPSHDPSDLELSNNIQTSPSDEKIQYNVSVNDVTMRRGFPEMDTQELESKSFCQNDLFLDGKDAMSLSPYNHKESETPSELLLLSQVGQQDAECLPTDENSASEKLHSEQIQTSNEQKQESSFHNIASEPAPKIHLDQPSSLESSRSAGEEINPTKDAMDPVTSILPDLSPKAAEANLEEMPPMPPLPPMQWRMGKVQHASLASQRESIEVTPASFLPTQPVGIDGNAQFSLLGSERETLQYQNPFLPVMAMGADKLPHTSGFSVSVPGQSFAIPLQYPVMVNDADSQYNYLLLQRSQIQNPFLTLPVISTGRPPHGYAFTSEGEVVQYSNPSLPMPLLESAPGHDYPQAKLVQPSSQLMINTSSDQQTSSNVETPLGSAVRHDYPQEKLAQPSSPLKNDTTLEVKALQQSSSNGEAEQRDPLLSSMSPPRMEAVQPHLSLLLPEDEMTLSSDNSAPISMLEGENPNGKPQNKLPRPRNPLIDAVAAHDKSTLRKVTERVRPQTPPKEEERGSLLEQIRTKSFNLKPAVVTRPSMQRAPKTNLKVAAILEKANAIRQALAGSDEDDDADSWSDS
ncbi:hypothetical protein L6164_002431 [Bauhinia variegata]|uniref:Uncharacterized protein n=1 Tax=Bauhinia variegata TaxID=167791 RepID=A0ACB9PXN2_BAUVA|nr:hypothetical protein L6164_002431 [Bauhinia variegata]